MLLLCFFYVGDHAVAEGRPSNNSQGAAGARSVAEPGPASTGHAVRKDGQG